MQTPFGVTSKLNIFISVKSKIFKIVTRTKNADKQSIQKQMPHGFELGKCVAQTNWPTAESFD